MGLLRLLWRLDIALILHLGRLSDNLGLLNDYAVIIDLNRQTGLGLRLDGLVERLNLAW